MTTQTSSFRTLLLLAVMTLIATACSSDSSPAANGAAGSASVSITSPADGATVTSPVTVDMSASEFIIEPAGTVRAGAGHFHLMINEPCVPTGELIPSDETHIHYGDAQTTAELDLEPGEYTICLQAGNGVHTALDLTDTITIVVESS